MLLSKEFRFEASHQLHNHPGKCARLHGHSWILTISVEGLVNPETGMVLDYGSIKALGQVIVDQLDHHHLGSGEVIIDEFHPIDAPDTQAVQWLPHDPHLKNFPVLPTSENLLIWIASQLPEDFPWLFIKLNETCTSEAVLVRADWEDNYAVNQKANDQETQEDSRGPKDAEGLEKEVLILTGKEFTDNDTSTPGHVNAQDSAEASTKETQEVNYVEEARRNFDDDISF